MNSRGLRITLVVLVVVAGGGTCAGFRIANARLRQRMEALRQTQAESGRLREDNRRTKTLLARVADDKDAAARAIQVEVGRLRGEVAELEKRAVAGHAQRETQEAAISEELATNRDPLQGLTRLEHCQNLGQATPAAAFQTLVWAALKLKGDDATLARVSVVLEPARSKAEALIAGLPENGRSQWTPERLAGMFFTGALGEVTAAQVLTESVKDPRHVTWRVRLVDETKETTIPMQWHFGTNGWQVVFDERFLGAVQKKIANAEVAVPRN